MVGFMLKNLDFQLFVYCVGIGVFEVLELFNIVQLKFCKSK